MITFDIILPTSGRASVFEAIESVNQQDYKNWWLWVVCDGFKELFWPYTDGRMRLPLQGQVIGSPFNSHQDSGAWARNEGLRLRRRGQPQQSDWIAYIDDDDVWLPNHLTTLVSLSILNPTANMLRTAGQSFAWKHKSPRSKKLVRKLGAINSSDILTVGMAHTRDLFERTSGWKPEDNHDKILWQEMLSLGGKPAVTEQVTFQFAR